MDGIAPRLHCPAQCDLLGREELGLAPGRVKDGVSVAAVVVKAGPTEDVG